MNKTTRHNTALRLGLAMLWLTPFILAGCGERQETHEEIIREGLLDIVNSLGKSCDQVVDHELTSEASYTMKCKSGDTYTISVTREGKIYVK
jgi:hypothetical protein